MDRKKFAGQIEKLDPNREIVKIDFTNSKITYSSKILKGRYISNLTDEELVRAYYVVKFVVELGYELSDIILEKEYSAGGRTKMKPRIDIILKDNRESKEKTYLFIETKSPDAFESNKDLIRNELFELGKLEDKTSPISYLCYCTADFYNDKIVEKNIIIDYNTYVDYDKWVEDGKLALDIFQRDYGIPRKINYIKDDVDLRVNVSKLEFDSIRKDLHNVLWGGGETNYNDIFVGLVKIFLAKIYDENITKPHKPYSFQVEYIGKNPESAEKVYEKVNKLYLMGCKTYLHYTDEELEGESLNKRSISVEKVRYVVEQLQGISLTKNINSHNDLLGDFFEKIVTEGFKQDKGQFFTHQNIVKFIIYALGIDDSAIEKINSDTGCGLPYICDPSCGSGTFLIDVMKIITDTILNKRKEEVSGSEISQIFVGYKLPKHKPNTWAFDYLYGIEINPDLALATKVNMVLHGDGSGNIYCKNALSPFNEFTNNEKINLLSSEKKSQNVFYKKPVNEQFDFIITNPPFSIKMENETKKKLPHVFEYANKGNIENLFVERYYQLLKDGGKAGIVLPENIFDTAENQYLRQFIYKFFKVKAVVSIGGGKDGAFLPYTPTKTSLLFIEKKSKKEVDDYDKVWRANSNLYAKLLRKVENIISNPIDNDINRQILNEFLSGYPGYHCDSTCTVNNMLINYIEEIKEIKKVSDWWIFARTSKEFDYPIFMAHTVELGYHRTKNREFKRNNKLFSVDDNGEITINISNPESILDYIKSKKNINEPNMFYINLSEISSSITLRLDYNFHTYKKFEEPHILDSFIAPPVLLRNYIKEIRNGKDIDRKCYSEDASGNLIETKYKYLTVSNYSPDFIDIDSMNNIVEKIGDNLIKYQLQKGDIIISRSGTVGVSKQFDIESNDIFIPAGYVIVVQIDSSKILPEFLEFYLNSAIMKRYFNVFGVGKTQKNIAQGDIKRIVLPDLSIEQQRNIISQLKSKYSYTKSEIEQKQKEIAELYKEWNEIVINSIAENDGTLNFLLQES